MSDAAATPRGDADAVLESIVVLDLTQIYNGPYATFLMARAGASVLKVEPPRGANLRKRMRRAGVSDPFASLNGGKRSIVLDLKTAGGRAVLLELASKADVLVENFAPGAMDRLGLGADALMRANPSLIYASGSGYGSSGPYRDFPAMDLSMQAMSGVMSTTGFPDGPPVKAGPALCDFLGGIHLYGAVVTALFRRSRTGRGSRVEAAMFDSIFPALASNTAMHAWGATGPSRTGNRHGGMAIAPYNLYPAADGHIAILAATERHWEGIMQALDLRHLERDPRFATKADRVANMDEVDRVVAERTSRLPRAEVFGRLVKERVPCAPVRELQEVVEDEHLHATGMVRWIDHAEYGRVLVHDSPIRFADHARAAMPPSPALGEHTEEILREMLGVDDGRIESLRAGGAIPAR